MLNSSMSSTPSANGSNLHIDQLFSVKGLHCVITGGASGIGLMITHALAANGAIVYISSRSSDQCHKIANEINTSGGQCHALPYDLSIIDNIRSLAKDVAKLTDRVDILINNSGTTWGEPIDTFKEKGWDRVYDLNVKSLFFGIQAFLPLLEAKATTSSPSRIINISSIAGLRHQLVPTYSYDSSKAAVCALTQKLAFDLASRHILCNAVCPGFIPSKMSQQLLNYASQETYNRTIPLGRFGAEQDIAGIILFLASPASNYITGANIPVDGGFTVSSVPFYNDSTDAKL